MSIFLKAVEFWSTFNIQISITLVIFWEKLQNYIFFIVTRNG